MDQPLHRIRATGSPARTIAAWVIACFALVARRHDNLFVGNFRATEPHRSPPAQ
jgi:hypothetical protein